MQFFNSVCSPHCLFFFSSSSFFFFHVVLKILCVVAAATTVAGSSLRNTKLMTGPTAADCVVHSAKTSVACSVQKKCTEGDGKGLKKILAKPLCKAAGCRMPDNVCVPPVAASTARFARQKTMLRSAKGPMDMAYPVKDVAGYDSATTAAEIAHKHAYAASILGTGTDRFTVHLLRHAIRKHVKESDPNVAYCPCLPSQKKNKGQELTEDQYTTIKKVGETIQQTGMVFKGEDNSVPNGVSDAAKDPEIQAWLSANTDRKIVGKKENYHECTRFIKKMFRDPVEVDDVGGTPKRTFHESFEIYQTELKKGNLFEAPGTIVYNSNALTGSGDHGVNNKPCGKEVSWEDLRKYTETSCEAKVDDTTNKFAFPNCAAGTYPFDFIFVVSRILFLCLFLHIIFNYTDLFSFPSVIVFRSLSISLDLSRSLSISLDLSRSLS